MSAARGATQRRTARPLERACSTAPERPESGPVTARAGLRAVDAQLVVSWRLVDD